MDLDKGLMQLYGPLAKFRGIQKKALKLIIAGTRRLMVIMGTGKGKSILFMLPAKVSQGGLTIVIVPLNALRDDMKRRCDEAGIESAEWSWKRPTFQAKVVFITPESAVTKAFFRFIQGRKVAGGIDRMIMDEYHMILDSHVGWRPKMLELVKMMDMGIQVVFLTATMRPKDEEEFFKVMGMVEGEIKVIREKTSRKNIEYSVMEYSRKEEIEEVRKVVESKLKEYETGKLIVYCDGIDRGQAIADELQAEIYNAQMGKEEMKKRVLVRLREGEERVWVASNALGVGIDIPDIRVVLHVGVKKKMRDYVQESGRAGRDGLKSEGIIMRAVEKFGNRVIGVGEGGVEAEMKEYLVGDVCRRKILEREMDGRGDKHGCEIGEERCDVCQGRSRGGKKRRMIVHNDEEGLRATQVRRTKAMETARERHLYDLSSDSEEEFEEDEEIVKVMEEVIMMDSGLEVGIGERVESSNDDKQSEVDEEKGDKGKEWWRQDGGGWKVDGSREFIEAWREQRRAYAAEERRRSEMKIGGREVIEMLEEKLREWKEKCKVCKAIGGERGKHCRGKDWRVCEYVTEWEWSMMEAGMESSRMIQMERFAGCWKCWMPREVCRRYCEDRRNRGGYVRFQEVANYDLSFDAPSVKW